MGLVSWHHIRPVSPSYCPIGQRRLLGTPLEHRTHATLCFVAMFTATEARPDALSATTRAVLDQSLKGARVPRCESCSQMDLLAVQYYLLKV